MRETDYETLLVRHLADYRTLFDRVELDLGPATTGEMDTDKRIEKFAESGDPQLVALLFQYGRYLMISSSRPGSPAGQLAGHLER